MGEFTHFNQHGDAIMVDISKKAETARKAIAEGRISMNQECFSIREIEIEPVRLLLCQCLHIGKIRNL